MPRAITATDWTWSVKAGDLDNDGREDLLFSSGMTRYWFNSDLRKEAALAVERGEGDMRVWLDSPKRAEPNLAFRNLGDLRFESVGEAWGLYYGAFGETPEKRLIEAKFEDDIPVPVRGKSCSTNAMPHLAEQFETFDEFARATLPEIYTADELDESLMLEVNTAKSYVLINDGKSGLAFEPLPRLAQISPGFGVTLTEVDGDGNADLYVVQNFFSPEPETGRMDGGLSLLLHGNGDGTFEVIGPDVSGLVVPGDAKSLAVTDLNDDGWVDFAVGLNDDEFVAFENSGSSRNRVFVIRLRGTVENPTAVGARVAVHFDTGLTQTAEVHAGGSYLSQSSADLVFGLPPSARVKRVEVRWPDGRRSESLPPFDDHRVTIKQPAGR